MSTTTVGFLVSTATVSAPPTPVLPAAFVQPVPTVTRPVPLKSWLAVKVASNTLPSVPAFTASPVSVPPSTVTSSAVKPVGASLKLKVTSELVSPSFRLPSTMSTVTVGLLVSMATVSLPPTPVLPAASVQPVPTLTEPEPLKPSAAVKVAS